MATEGSMSLYDAAATSETFRTQHSNANLPNDSHDSALCWLLKRLKVVCNTELLNLQSQLLLVVRLLSPVTVPLLSSRRLGS
jgi:hypothetical protein